MEEWRDVVGYEGLYQVSDLGRIKSLERWCGHHTVHEKILKHNINRKGYHSVQLSKDGVPIRYEIHRLVGKTFISKDCECFNHLDGNKNDNSVSNLEAASFSENINHAVDVLFNHVRALIVNVRDKNGNEIVFGSMSKAGKYFNKSSHWLKQKRKNHGNIIRYGDFIIEILER